MKPTPTRHPGVMKRGPDWWIQATATDPTGRRIFRRRLLPGDLPLVEVVKARADLMAALAAELATTPPPSPALTVAGFVLRWMQARRPRLRPSTAARYLTALDHVLVPHLGHRAAASLTRTDGQRLAAHLEGMRLERSGQLEPYSQDTLLGWWRIFRTVLADLAVETGIPDPCARVAPPRSAVRDRRERRTLTAEQVRALLAATAERHPAWWVEVVTAAATGARAGELHALEWRDLDATAGTLTIQRAVWKGIVSETKTRRPRRVGLPAEIVAILESHRRAQVPESNLLFPSDLGGYRFPSSLEKVLGEAAAVAGIEQRVTPQVLRRTLNSLLIEAGTPGPVLRSVLGHTTERMTGHYYGGSVEAQRAALVAVGVTPAGGVAPGV